MKQRKIPILFGIFFALFVLFCMISVVSGSYRIPLNRFWEILTGNGTAAENLALLDIRLPRMCIGILVGVALSVSGVVLQTVTKNPLAEPGMIGINAGAALLVVLFITASKSVYYDTLSVNRVIALPLIAILGGGLACFLVYFLANKKGIRPVRLILVGIGVNSGINAIISYIQLTSSRGDFNQVLTWTNGSLWGSSWLYVKMVSVFVALLLIYIIWKIRVLDVLQLGEELATGLGISVQKETRNLFFAAAMLAAVATAVAGNIAFLGLLGPQIAKRLVGGRMRYLIPLSGMIGASILVLSDTIARNLFSPVELPVGIVVSMIGVPYFVYLMLKEK